jgi:hypothetical protein
MQKKTALMSAAGSRKTGRVTQMTTVHSLSVRRETRPNPEWKLFCNKQDLTAVVEDGTQILDLLRVEDLGIL